MHPSLEDITVEGILHALSDPVRAHILAKILRANGAKTCSAFLQISDRPIPKSTLSQHFKALREAGLIRSERRGVELYNTRPLPGDRRPLRSAGEHGAGGASGAGAAAQPGPAGAARETRLRWYGTDARPMMTAFSVHRGSDDRRDRRSASVVAIARPQGDRGRRADCGCGVEQGRMGTGGPQARTSGQAGTGARDPGDVSHGAADALDTLVAANPSGMDAQGARSQESVRQD